MAANVNAQSFIPQIWDASVYRTLEDNLIGRKICNLKPQSEIKAAGDTVYFNGLNDPTVSDYTGSISYETLKSSQLAMLIDQQKYYAFKVTDVENAMANVDLKGSQTERAAYLLNRQVDSYVLGTNISNDASGGTVTQGSLTSANVLSTISAAVRYLEENNVMNNRWMVLPPWVKEKLMLAGVKFQINNGINGKGGMAWTNYLDVDIYISNTVPTTGQGTATPVSTCMAGSYNSIVFAEKLMESRAMQLENSFDVGVSGLLVFGAKVAKPKELVKLALTGAAETTI